MKIYIWLCLLVCAASLPAPERSDSDELTQLAEKELDAEEGSGEALEDGSGDDNNDDDTAVAESGKKCEVKDPAKRNGCCCGCCNNCCGCCNNCCGCCNHCCHHHCHKCCHHHCHHCCHHHCHHHCCHHQHHCCCPCCCCCNNNNGGGGGSSNNNCCCCCNNSGGNNNNCCCCRPCVWNCIGYCCNNDNSNKADAKAADAKAADAKGKAKKAKSARRCKCGKPSKLLPSRDCFNNKLTNNLCAECSKRSHKSKRSIADGLSSKSKFLNLIKRSLE